MPESFGARLRQQREERQIDLIAIAERTKIKLSLLEGLERDDVSRWPSGIFRRAYIRSYAHFIGLDPDTVLREFLEVHPDPADLLTALAAASEDTSKVSGPPPTRLRTMVDSAIASLVKLRQPAARDDVPSPVAASPGNGRAPVPADRAAVGTSVSPPTRSEAARADAALPSWMPEPTAQELLALAAQSFEGEPAAQDEGTTLPAVESEPSAPHGPGGSIANWTGADADRAEPGDGMREEVAARELERRHEATLDEIARLCTEFGRVSNRRELQQLLQEAAGMLTATGLIAWLWDEMPEELRPALAYGYSDSVLAYLPPLKRNADNATAASFRTANACEVAATADTSGALVVPLLTADGCAGVLAIELQPGIQPARSVRAKATILAATLAQLVERSRPAEQVPAVPAAPAAAKPRPPLRPIKATR